MPAGTSWPPANGLTTINVPREAATLTTVASERIEAPASSVFDTLLDVKNYSKWNSFCPKVTIHRQPDDENDQRLHAGTLFTLHVIMNAQKPHSETPTKLLVTDISTPDHPSQYIESRILEIENSFTADLKSVYRISWKCEGGFASKGLKTERFHEIISLGPHECEVRTWENQGGVLAHTVRWMYKKTLEEKFQLWCNDLKKFCEGRAKEESDGGAL